MGEEVRMTSRFLVGGSRRPPMGSRDSGGRRGHGWETCLRHAASGAERRRP